MEQNPKLPIHEASGRKPLNGSYKVSFQLEMTAEDQFTISDLTQAITEGFGDGLIERVADLSVEKIIKEGNIEQKILKAGDRVHLTKNVTVKATVLEDNGIYSVGLPTDSSVVVGEYTITVTEGSHAVVNQVTDGKAELIEVDAEAIVAFRDEETDESWDAPINVDLISVDLSDVEAV